MANAIELNVFHVDSYDGTVVKIDLNKNTEAPKLITLFGQQGWGIATLKKKATLCEYLCGEGDEEGKECHNVGVYLLSNKEQSGKITAPILAIKGRHNIKNTGDNIRFENFKSKPNPDDFISKDFSMGYRWNKDNKTGKVHLFSEYMGPKGVGSKDWYAPPIDLENCKLSYSKDFKILDCNVVSLLYHQEELVDMSVAEYSSGKLALKFSIDIDDALFYILEVSVKGHGQRLKMIRYDGKRWIEYFRPPDYAALC